MGSHIERRARNWAFGKERKIQFNSAYPLVFETGRIRSKCRAFKLSDFCASGIQIRVSCQSSPHRAGEGAAASFVSNYEVAISHFRIFAQRLTNTVEERVTIHLVELGPEALKDTEQVQRDVDAVKSPACALVSKIYIEQTLKLMSSRVSHPASVPRKN